MSPARPPRWARALVETLVDDRHGEFILGDLEESYARLRDRAGPARATIAYLWLGLRSGAAGHGAELLLGLAGDARYALTQLRRHPRVHVGSALVLALGVGMLTASWGIEFGAYGRGLPVSAPDRMVAVVTVDSTDGSYRSAFSPADLDVLRREGSFFDAVSLWGLDRVAVADAAHPPERADVLEATPGLFGLLELRPVRGRAFTPADARPGAPPVAILGYRMWQRRFDADPGVLGSTIRIDGTPTTVVGILPEGSSFQGEELWLPIPVGTVRHARRFAVLGRLARGVTPTDADVRVSGVAAHMEGPGDARARPRVGGVGRVRVVPFTESFREPNGPGARYLRVTTRAGWLLFFMALANVCNLFLVRARERVREVAVRRALGAGWLRIIRQTTMEVGLATLVGTVGAALLASATLAWYQTHHGEGVQVSWRVWSFGLPHVWVLVRAAFLALALVSVVTVVAAWRGDRATAVRSQRGTTSRLRFAQALVALEIAGAGALFLLAALMIRSAWNLRTTDWGFAPTSVMTGHLVLDKKSPTPPEERMRLWSRLQASLGAIPGVTSATLATQLPVIRYAGSWGAVRAVEVEGGGSVESDPARLPHHYVDAVTPTYFATFGTDVAEGRPFTSADVAGAEPVALLNQAFVRAYFPSGDALGHRVRVWDGDEPGPWRVVVGIAPDLWMDADENRHPQGLYVPVAQAAPPEVSVAIRVRGDPNTYAGKLRVAVSEVVSDVPLTDVMSMPALIRFQTRLYAREGPLFICLGVVALLLAVAGLYAVVSYVASLRAKELAVRAALGASRGRLVVRSTLWGVVALAVGVPGGVLLGLWLTRGFARFMFEVDPWSPGVATAGFGLLIVTAVLAGLLPAVRAGRVDVRRILEAE